MILLFMIGASVIAIIGLLVFGYICEKISSLL